MQSRLFSTYQTRLAQLLYEVDLAPQRGAIAVCVIGKRLRRLRQDLVNCIFRLEGRAAGSNLVAPVNSLLPWAF